MPAANHSFSSIAYWINRKSAGVALGVGLLALAGCNSSKSNLGSSLSDAASFEARKSEVASADLPPVNKGDEAKADKLKIGSVKSRTQNINALETKAPKTKLSKTKAFVAPASPSIAELQSNNVSARCRYLYATAGAEATLLRSPTLSGEVDHEGNLGASLGYDVVDVRRARLKEELADADCRRATAISRITGLLVTSPQALTRAGYLAKANSMRNSRGALSNIRREIRNGVNEGLITRQSATILRQNVDRVQAQEARIRGEASRRNVVDAVQIQSVDGLDKELVAAEREVARLSRKLRDADTVKLNLSGGYNVEEDDNTFMVLCAQNVVILKMK